ncbi:hypothetical protein [Pedobacter nototheniae]|uniref:hypothetical protein n=1 Tax=Pedobacter nototheniae TaxID=2488994 RepID=UPI0010403EC2|nr:hypothetical protein [Pedobacter nototheniae]
MKKLLTLLILFYSCFLHAQNLQEKKFDLPDGSKLIYQTINNALNGLYEIKDGSLVLLRGNYVNEKRVGNWYLFNKDKSLFARYNYDAKKLLFVDSKMLALATIKINSGNTEIDTKASVSLPILSIEQYFPIASTLATDAIPDKDKNTLDPNSITITAAIDEVGAAKYTVNYLIKNEKINQRLELDKFPFKIDWIPASYEGKAYPSEFIIKVKINNKPADGNHRRFNWL